MGRWPDQHDCIARGKISKGSRAEVEGTFILSFFSANQVEPSYALIATATDYDSWREQEEAVTTAKVLETLEVNADTSRVVAQKILDDLHTAITDPNNGDIFLEEIGKMQSSIMTQSAAQKQEDRDKLAFVLPEYFRCS